MRRLERSGERRVIVLTVTAIPAFYIILKLLVAPTTPFARTRGASNGPQRVAYHYRPIKEVASTDE
jgi:hypothetical protein